jgi:hypothetical protein
MPEQRIGTILHYWPRVGAAQIELEGTPLHLGDRVHIRGHGHDFTQPVESLEIDHVSKQEGWPGEFVALAVAQPVREDDEVWLVR